MDVLRASTTLLYLSTMLSVARQGAAEDGFIEVGDTNSTIVFATSDEPGEPVAMAEDLGSELVVHASDAHMATVASGPAPRGTLSVVANSARKAPLARIVNDSAVQPAAARANVSASQTRDAAWSNRFSGAPRRPAATSGIAVRQTRSGNAAAVNVPGRSALGRSQASEKPANKQLSGMAYADDLQDRPKSNAAAGPKQSSTQTAKLKTSASQPTSAADLLVQAYQLSTTAGSEGEYSQIVRWCADAMRQGLDGENRDFALQLSSWSLNRRGQLRADQGQRETALADFRAALEFDPQCWRALHNRGVTLAQCGQFAEAFDDITKVIELNPQFAKAYSNRATLYVQAGDHEHAIADYDSALHIDPKLLQALVGRGRVCHMTGDLERALESLNAAIELDGANAEVICSRGDLLADLGRYADALLEYAKAIDLNPKFEHAYRNGAWLLATCPDDAIRDAEGALNGAKAALECGYGERHAALDTLAAALANAGRFEEAVGTMQQAIEVAPPEAAEAYQARQQLYESGQPFRTYPVEDPVQEAEFVEG